MDKKVKIYTRREKINILRTLRFHKGSIKKLQEKLKTQGIEVSHVYINYILQDKRPGRNDIVKVAELFAKDLDHQFENSFFHQS